MCGPHAPKFGVRSLAGRSARQKSEARDIVRDAFGDILKSKRAASVGGEAFRCPGSCSQNARSEFARVAIAFLLVLTLAFFLSGCRDTDVLTQKVIDPPGVSEIDYSLDPVRADDPDSSREDVANRYEGEAEDQDRELQQDLPDYSEGEPTTQDAAPKSVYDNSTSLNGKTPDIEGGTSDGSAGDAADSANNNEANGRADESGDTDRVGESYDEPNDEPDNNEEPPPAEPSDEPDNNEEPPPSEPSGEQIYIEDPPATDDPQPEGESEQASPENPGDNDGTWNALPDGNGNGTGDNEQSQGSTYADGTYDTIPSAGKVAAAGPYATIVQSLGGKGALAAAPQQWLDELPAAAYSNGAELEDVKGIVAWGDGTQMTDAAVQAIIESGAECVLSSNTYNIMNQNQAEAFNKAGVDVLVVPDIGAANAMDADIVMAVDVLGEVFKDAGSDIQYNAKSAAATWKSLHNGMLETCRVGNGGLSFYYVYGAGGLLNFIYQGEYNDTSYNRITGSSKRIWAECIDDWDDENDIGLSLYGCSSDGAGSGLSSFNLIDYYFQHAGIVRVHLLSQHNSQLEAVTGRIIATARVPEVAQNEPADNGDGLSTPVLIARTEALANKVAALAGSSADAAYNLGEDYDVWVMPSGICGSWNDGSFESFLLAPWAYSMVRGNGTSDADPLVNDFYQTFYRCGAADALQGYGTVVRARCAN